MPHVVIPDEAEERLDARRGQRVRLYAVLAGVLLALVAVGALLWRRRSAEAARETGGELRNTELPAPPPVFRGDTAGARRAPYRVQVGSFTDRGQASEFARKLRVEGWNAELVEEPPGAAARFRVHVGPYTERERAERVARVLRQTLDREVVLVEVR